MVRRFDIQFLRGIAVLAVIGFHAFRDALPKGFLGVDVFFVISGFLITGMILRQLEGGGFSFRSFFARRARRLLPASLTTLAMTTVLASFILMPNDLDAYARQLFGAMTFTANFFLAQQTDYFAGAAETKPLLHIWSLSLEEQFYLIAPLLLWLTPLRGRPFLLIAGALLSAALCYVMMSGMPLFGVSSKGVQKLVFFMLPTRAWELLIGGIAAWVMLRRPGLAIAPGAKFAALVVILFMCGVGIAPAHPGPDALIVTLATALVLLGRDDWLLSNPISRGVARIGDWSYSVYLVHWPLFAFAFILYLGDPPSVVMILLSLLSVVLGWAQYRWVERPFLTGPMRSPRRAWPALGALGAGLLIASGAIASAAAPPSAMEPVQGLARPCDQRGADYQRLPACESGEGPGVLLWGDSYAMQLVPGLRRELGDSIHFAQATKSACAPVPDFAQFSRKYTATWARDCGAFNRSVLSGLASQASIRHVILASAWTQVFDPASGLVVDGETRPWSPVGLEYLERAVREILAMGKQVILVGPTAVAHHDVGACNARLRSNRPFIREGGCEPRAGEVQDNIGAVLAGLRAVAAATGARLLLPSEAMCPAGHCASRVDGESIYRDHGHLTAQGSVFVVSQLGLRRLLEWR